MKKFKIENLLVYLIEARGFDYVGGVDLINNEPLFAEVISEILYQESDLLDYSPGAIKVLIEAYEVGGNEFIKSLRKANYDNIRKDVEAGKYAFNKNGGQMQDVVNDILNQPTEADANWDALLRKDMAETIQSVRDYDTSVIVDNSDLAEFIRFVDSCHYSIESNVGDYTDELTELHTAYIFAIPVSDDIYNDYGFDEFDSYEALAQFVENHAGNLVSSNSDGEEDDMELPELPSITNVDDLVKVLTIGSDLFNEADSSQYDAISNHVLGHIESEVGSTVAEMVGSWDETVYEIKHDRAKWVNLLAGSLGNYKFSIEGAELYINMGEERYFTNIDNGSGEDIKEVIFYDMNDNLLFSVWVDENGTFFDTQQVGDFSENQITEIIDALANFGLSKWLEWLEDVWGLDDEDEYDIDLPVIQSIKSVDDLIAVLKQAVDLYSAHHDDDEAREAIEEHFYNHITNELDEEMASDVSNWRNTLLDIENDRYKWEAELAQYNTNNKFVSNGYLYVKSEVDKLVNKGFSVIPTTNSSGVTTGLESFNVRQLSANLDIRTMNEDLVVQTFLNIDYNDKTVSYTELILTYDYDATDWHFYTLKPIVFKLSGDSVIVTGDANDIADNDLTNRLGVELGTFDESEITSWFIGDTIEVGLYVLKEFDAENSHDNNTQINPQLREMLNMVDKYEKVNWWVLDDEYEWGTGNYVRNIIDIPLIESLGYVVNLTENIVAIGRPDFDYDYSSDLEGLRETVVIGEDIDISQIEDTYPALFNYVMINICGKTPEETAGLCITDNGDRLAHYINDKYLVQTYEFISNGDEALIQQAAYDLDNQVINNTAELVNYLTAAEAEIYADGDEDAIDANVQAMMHTTLGVAAGYVMSFGVKRDWVEILKSMSTEFDAVIAMVADPEYHNPIITDIDDYFVVFTKEAVMHVVPQMDGETDYDIVDVSNGPDSYTNIGYVDPNISDSFNATVLDPRTLQIIKNHIF